MKNIIKNLEKELELLRNIVQTREDYVYDRSEKWQEAEKCGEYEDKTMDIEAQANDLDNIINELKELL